MPKPIVIWPDKVLSTRTRPVTEFGPALDALLEEMMESLRAAEGIGIAANQIGVSLAIAWVGREDGTFFEIANPVVLEKSEPVSLEEGCLSVPHEWEQTPRFAKVRVRYQDRTGAQQELTAEGRLRNCLFALDEVDVKPFLRDRPDDDALAEVIHRNVRDKWEGHEINTARFVKPLRTMHAIGG